MEAGAGLVGLLAEAFAEAAEPDVAAEVVGHPVERVMNLGINKEIFSTKILKPNSCKKICGTGLHAYFSTAKIPVNIKPAKRMVAGTQLYYKSSFHTMRQNKALNCQDFSLFSTLQIMFVFCIISNKIIQIPQL